jgi:hypothetical protein
MRPIRGPAIYCTNVKIHIFLMVYPNGKRMNILIMDWKFRDCPALERLNIFGPVS